MFTIKYRMTDGSEVIEGGYTHVTASVGEFLPRLDLPDDHPDNAEPLRRRVVTGLKPSGQTTTFGPVYTPDIPMSDFPQVWVMNESGATVGKYDLL